jgi:hypothetical protein
MKFFCNFIFEFEALSHGTWRSFENGYKSGFWIVHE